MSPLRRPQAVSPLRTTEQTTSQVCRAISDGYRSHKKKHFPSESPPSPSTKIRKSAITERRTQNKYYVGDSLTQLIAQGMSTPEPR